MIHTPQTPKKIITKIPANPLLSERKNEYKQIRVAAYCRVSTDSEDQLQSYKAQVAYYTDAIAKNPRWKMVDIYADATVIIGLKQNPTIGRRFSPIFSFFEHLSGKYGRCYT